MLQTACILYRFLIIQQTLYPCCGCCLTGFDMLSWSAFCIFWSLFGNHLQVRSSFISNMFFFGARLGITGMIMSLWQWLDLNIYNNNIRVSFKYHLCDFAVVYFSNLYFKVYNFSIPWFYFSLSLSPVVNSPLYHIQKTLYVIYDVTSRNYQFGRFGPVHRHRMDNTSSVRSRLNDNEYMYKEISDSQDNISIYTPCTRASNENEWK